MSNTNSIQELLLKEIKDPYVQENFYRLKLYLERIGAQIGSGDTTINNFLAGTAVWEKFSRTIPASSTLIVDTIPLVSFRSISYIMNTRAPSTDREKNLKMDINKDDSQLKKQVYALSGAPLNVEINELITGPNYELEMVNNELFSVEVNFSRLTLP